MLMLDLMASLGILPYPRLAHQLGLPPAGLALLGAPFSQHSSLWLLQAAIHCSSWRTGLQAQPSPYLMSSNQRETL